MKSRSLLAKEEIRQLLKTDPSARTSISSLIAGPFLSAFSGSIPLISAVASDASLCLLDSDGPGTKISPPDSAIGSTGGENCCEGLKARCGECEEEEAMETEEGDGRNVRY